MKNFTGLSLQDYLTELSSPEPVPGGGSVSAYAAALGTGLIQMVGSVSLKRKKKQGLSPEEEKKEDAKREAIQKIVNAIERIKKEALEKVDEDPDAYQKVIQAAGRPEKMENALADSFRVQAGLASLVVQALESNHSLAELVSGSIKNDLKVSAALLDAAFKGAYHTAEINVVYMKDAEKKQKAEKNLAELKEKFQKENVHAG